MTTFVGIVISFLTAVSLIVFVSFRLAAQWRWIPVFVRNNVGRHWAFCSRADFRSPDRKEHGLSFVKRTLYDQDLMADLGEYWHKSISIPTLFVPFTSNGIWTDEKQRGFFDQEMNTSDGVREYLKNTLAEAAKQDRRIWFAQVVDRHTKKLTQLLFLSAVCTVALFILGMTHHYLH